MYWKNRWQLYKTTVFLTVLILWLTGCGSQKQAKQRSGRDISRSEHHRLNASDARTDRIIQAARSYTGVPFRWGGTSRAGMDCSGLLVVAFQAGEMVIPRTSHEQSKIGKNISLYELHPGDLVFFAAKKGQPGKVTHVGMITEVRGKRDVQFIHASTKLGVVENNIYSDYYQRIFVKARRPF